MGIFKKFYDDNKGKAFVVNPLWVMVCIILVVLIFWGTWQITGDLL